MGKINITASGGTCTYVWSLIENNSMSSSLIKVNNVSAIYTAGPKEFSVDIIELSDGITLMRIEVTVVPSDLRSDGKGCFIRNKRTQRD